MQGTLHLYGIPQLQGTPTPAGYNPHLWGTALTCGVQPSPVGYPLSAGYSPHVWGTALTCGEPLTCRAPLTCRTAAMLDWYAANTGTPKPSASHAAKLKPSLSPSGAEKRRNRKSVREALAGRCAR